MKAYKTPGVYVVEKSIFPPSVAQVETAIPAFIGYTEKAEDKAGDLTNKARKVSSLLEFRQYFGGPPPLNISKVTLDSGNSLTEASVQPQYYMYDSLQLFFMNGGGDCYIVSVGPFKLTGDPVDFGELNNGLAVLETVDEPTIIVFPDAVLLKTASKMYDLQKAALGQCNKLMDRVAVFDLREDDPHGTDFRDHIGTNFLKYGAAYTPYLKTSLEKSIKYRQIRNNASKTDRFNRSGVPITLGSLTNDKEIKDRVGELDTAVNDVDLLASDLETLSAKLKNTYGVPEAQSKDLRNAFDFLYNKAIAENTSPDNYKNTLNFLYEVIVMADKWFYFTNSSQTSEEFKGDAVSDIFPAVDALVTSLISFDATANASNMGLFNLFENFKGEIVSIGKYDSGWVLGGSANAGTPFTGTNPEKRATSLPTINNLFQQTIVSIDALIELGNSRMKAKEDSVLEQFPIYKNLVESLKEALSTIPPSGAIAGVYAQVDRNRGVWKAPANVSLNGVADLTEHFTESQTDALNVDTNFGKSINAIKFMTGMGFMVWGARTLAGNDNEWRYISVRRFFNMVEESCKKSTMWAVFEPNDAGTWIKVKGMIENFLTLQWRSGALQGAKPDDAFFVKVGLGETMTSIDILEGRMNVEIGMAVVRPAEFIILTFSHKMVTSS